MAKSNDKKRKIIIDTDPGVDDALAIILAVKSKLVDILALTTVAGNVSVEFATRNAQYILNLLEQTIPIYSGESKPLKRALIKASVHGNSGLGAINPRNSYQLTNTAVDKILALSRQYPNEITLIALGPLTNIAKAIIKDPFAMKNIREIVIMGGAIKVPGNMSRVAEFNMFVDPEAADIVFHFPITKTLIPLDLCNQVVLSPKDIMKITNNKLREEILGMVNTYREKLSEEGVVDAVMYDPVALYSFLFLQKVTFTSYDIAIETRGKVTRGMTVADFRSGIPISPNITVVTEINSIIWKKDFIRILNS